MALKTHKFLETYRRILSIEAFAFAIAVLVAVFITGGVWVLTRVWFADALRISSVFLLFVNVLIVSLGVGVIRHMRVVKPISPSEIAQSVAPLEQQTLAASEGARPPLAKRLPEGVEGEILHLSVSDHHVDIHTENGSASVRMRLADAIELMGGEPGVRPHRSHWVTQKAIEGTVREQGRLFLTLKTGARVPVSRGAKPVLEQAGIL